jgi:serine-type D-Ala-D-Ala carboxypeptidase
VVELSDCGALAALVVREGVAPRAACGWAARSGDGAWAFELGGAGGPRAEAAFFDLASLTKPMTAVALARSGLDRATPLGRLVPEARGTVAEDAPIELLLAHRAGHQAHVSLYQPLAEGRPLDRAEALRAAASARREDAEGPPPAAGFPPVYSDLGYALVGEALARHLGVADAGEAIGALVVEPLGLGGELGTARALRAQRVGFDERVVATEIVSWRGGEVRGAVHDENAWALTGDGGSGHAGMFGTVRAVLSFGAAVLDAVERREGPLASGDMQWLVTERPGGTLRAGFDGKNDPSAGPSSAGESAGPRTFGHLGFTGTSLWIDPDAGAATALLSNRVHPTRDNLAIRAARPVVHDALFGLARGFVERAARP